MWKKAAPFVNPIKWDSKPRFVNSALNGGDKKEACKACKAHLDSLISIRRKSSSSTPSDGCNVGHRQNGRK